MTDAERFPADLEAKARAAVLRLVGAEQFLADLEIRARAAKKNWGKKYSEDDSDEAIDQLEAAMNFIDMANPAAVLRLIGMVRELRDHCAQHMCPHGCNCRYYSYGEVPDMNVCKTCWLSHAYAHIYAARGSVEEA